ncbi:MULTISPECIES: molecular chaperone [Pantoea]|uniref:fimbrial biogenesis chaperone n=1 Tax=Pantoea TaxID=53335 RepID=UPI000BB583E9|nr:MULTISPECIES: molecular chaperone [Pantoea]PNK63380.1 molecular chaperone [Pantoea sp. FDAARGOS_194]
MSLFIRAIFLLAASFFTHTVQASITVGGTRLIYNGAEKEAFISVTNSKSSVPYLIQSWVELDEKSSEKVPFIVTPPLFRLDGGHENTLRVIYTGEKPLPNNRESVFWLNVKSIPAMEKSEQNRLLIAVKTRIKLFYRPAELKTDNANEAWRNLSFKQKGSQTVITNGSPYFISLYALTLGGKRIKQPPMIAPFASVTVAGSGREVAWKAINDFGGVTEEARQALP